MNSVLSQNNHSCFVPHRATQLKLKVWNIKNTTVDSERTVTTSTETLHKMAHRDIEKSHHPSLNSVTNTSSQVSGTSLSETRDFKIRQHVAQPSHAVPQQHCRISALSLLFIGHTLKLVRVPRFHLVMSITSSALQLIQTRDGSHASEFPLTSSVYNSFKLVTHPVFLEFIHFPPFGGDNLQRFLCECSFGCAKFGEVTHARRWSRGDDNNKMHVCSFYMCWSQRETIHWSTRRRSCSTAFLSAVV